MQFTVESRSLLRQAKDQMEQRGGREAPARPRGPGGPPAEAHPSPAQRWDAHSPTWILDLRVGSRPRATLRMR